MDQTPTIPISNLSIGSIAKIPSLPNMGELTILNSNSCGVRVKGSETSNNKTTVFDHTISCQTPVVLVGYNEEIAKENLAKQEKMRDMFGGGEGVQSFLAEENKIENDKDSTNVENNDLEVQNNNIVNNNMEQQNNQPTENSDSSNSFTQMTNSYTRPNGNFTAREFADLNKIQYNIALAYLKLNAKDMGKKPGGGRGRPTNLYSFD